MGVRSLSADPDREGLLNPSPSPRAIESPGAPDLWNQVGLGLATLLKPVSFAFVSALVPSAIFPAPGLMLVLAGLTATAAFLLTYQHATRLLEYLIGITAGFEFAQIHHVHLFSFVCAAYVLFGTERPTRHRWGAAALLMAAAVALAVTALFGDLVNSRSLGVQLIVLAGCASAVTLKVSADAAQAMAYGLLAVCTVGAVAAIGQRVGVIPYTPFADPNQLGRVKGIWHEPDWLGMYTAIGVLLTFRLRISARLHVALVSLLAIALMLSLARAAWIGLIAAALIAFAQRRESGQSVELRRRNRRIATAAVAVVGFLAAVNPSLRGNVANRVGAIVGTQQADVSVVARQQQNRAMQELASTAPWYGHGLSAAGRVDVSGHIDFGNSPNNVASNWLLGWWVDGRLLALPLMIVIIGAVVLTLGSTGGLIAILVLAASFASNAVMLPILWFALGLAMAQIYGRVSRTDDLTVRPNFSHPFHRVFQPRAQNAGRTSLIGTSTTGALSA
jgi:energy-converting hydrogenase Eha subunit A